MYSLLIEQLAPFVFGAVAGKDQDEILSWLS